MGKDDDWFQRTMPHCTPPPEAATDEEIACHYIVLSGNAIVGGCGAYPMEWVVSNGTRRVALPIFGIGQVGCLQEARGRGVMSGVVKRAIAESVEKGAVLSFLSGDRFRYSRFGYDFGTVYTEYKFSKQRLEQLCAAVEGRRAGEDDISQLDSLYTTLPSYTVRSGHKWRRQINRGNLEYLLAPNAYVCLHEGKGAMEAAGEPAEILGMLLCYMREKELGEMTLSGPFGARNALSKALADAAMNVSLVGHELICLHKPEEILKTLELPGDADVRSIFSQPFHQVSGGEGQKPLCAWFPTADCI